MRYSFQENCPGKDGIRIDEVSCDSLTKINIARNKVEIKRNSENNNKNKINAIKIW